MDFSRCPLTIPIIGFLILLFFLAAVPAQAEDWQPIDPSLLQRTQPKLDPDADAEYILHKTRVEDRVLSGSDVVLIYSYYVRMKIYTERGKEKYSTIDIAAPNDGMIRELKGRTVLPDGKIVPLEKDSVFERDVKRPSGRTIRRRSFAMPSVSVGSVIEYQWNEYYNGRWSNNLHLDVQQDEPVWELQLQVKPIDFSRTNFSGDLQMTSRSFQCKPPSWKRVGPDWYGISMQDIPAFREEQFMPPVDGLRSWIFFYYEERNPPEGKKFWQRFGKKKFEETKEKTKSASLVKTRAAEIVAGAATPEEKVARLVNYCRTKVKNIRHPLSKVSAADLGDWKPILKPSETLERGMGTPMDVQYLLIALAQEAGFDARLAWLVGRDAFFFEVQFPNDYFVNRANVAIKVENEWKFFDVAQPFLEPGMLSWPEEGVAAVIPDPKELVVVTTPISPPSRNTFRKVAHLSLDEEGTLKGTVDEAQSGYSAVSEKMRLARMTEEERRQAVEEDLKERYPSATVSGLEVLNADDVDQLLTYRYTISVPNYAERTGKRLFVLPSFFRRGQPALFTSSKREFPIYFYHGWLETDHVEIALPEGYELDSPDAPSSFQIGETGEYAVKMRLVKTGKDRILIYDRKLEMGREGKLLYPQEAYPALKKVFETVRQGDDHAIVLKQQAATSAGAI
ncbi:MAG: transglutaminase domain-containing protein [Bryobacterales bacterium]|nr:transglutaminase domain-containing protein [Bryobacterales bacterium]